MAPSDILSAPILDSPKAPNGKWETERQAFARMLPDLLRTHRDQYVAIHGGQVVAAGTNLIDVAMSAYARHGYIPIYVDRVAERPERPVRIPTGGIR